MTEKKQRKPGSGGSRKNAGRKRLPYAEKKQQIPISVSPSKIEKLGKKGIRQICEKAINEAVLK